MTMTPAVRVGLPHRTRVLRNVRIPLSDGVGLSATIVLPVDAEAYPVPAILEYLPYRKDDVTAADDALRHPYLAGHGYAAVRVDIRGSGNSEGVLLDEYHPQEQADAVEVIAWLADQPWCDGAVGLMGISWSGCNSLQIAACRPPALRAILTACSTDDRYDNDVHYMGGALLGYYLAPWAAVMAAFNARPPDPEVVGERWRELWLDRLANSPMIIDHMLAHQRRDDYWRHGSVCEDYGAIQCPVYAVGGWIDAYTDAIFRLMQKLECPRKALIGPWGHMFPEIGSPGPAIGFLQESLRWWDYWLKGLDTGVMGGPMIRAWMQEPVRPRATYGQRPGRWVAEPAWPPSEDRDRPLALRADGSLAPEFDDPPRAVSHASPVTVGLDGGAWCPYGNHADLPPDQRRDDALSLSFTSAPLLERAELFGAPELELLIAADRPVGFVAVRLCDVWPDGESTRITRAVLNLCHRNSHAEPSELEPGRPYRVRFPLKAVGYALAPGHRLRVAISTNYWPWIWPSPEPVTITVTTGGESLLHLPVRQPRSADDELEPFGAPEIAPPLEFEWLRRPEPELSYMHDMVTGRTDLRMARAFTGGRAFADGLKIDDRDPVTFTIFDGDPLSARVRSDRRIEIGRGDWRTRVELQSTMTADAERFHVTTTLEAYEGETRVHARTHVATARRDHL